MRPITDILREIRRGRAVDQATRLLSEVVLAVDETGKPGEVTITIKVKPAKEGGSEKTLQGQGAERRYPRGGFLLGSIGRLASRRPGAVGDGIARRLTRRRQRRRRRFAWWRHRRRAFAQRCRALINFTNAPRSSGASQHARGAMARCAL
jgi:hypothetical protein